jgi:hypothetical protein
MGTTGKHCLKHSGQMEVGDESAAPGEKAFILLSYQRLTNKKLATHGNIFLPRKKQWQSRGASFIGEMSW